MKIGDAVEVVGQLKLGEDGRGVVEALDWGRVAVKFPDGWRRFYDPQQLRVVEAAPAVQGAGA